MNTRLYPRWRLAIAAVLTIGSWLLDSPALLKAATINWHGGGGNNSWHTPANWSGDVVPGPADDVVINVAGDITVVHSSGTTQVRSLRSEEGFQLGGGSLTLTAGTSFVHGIFWLGAGTFTVRGAGTTFTATGIVTNETANIAARQGAILSLPTWQSLSRTVAGHSYVTSVDAGSVVDLPNLTSATVPSFYRFQLEAFDGGHINTPSLAQISAIGVYSDGPGSVVDLSGVHGTLLNATPGTASLEALNLGAIIAPNLTGLERVSLYLRTGAQFPTAQLGAVTGAELLLDATTNSFPALTNVLATDLTVRRTGRLSLPGVTRVLRTNSGPLTLSASDAGSLLELPNATNAAVEPFYRLQVEAYQGGRVSLPRLGTMDGGIGGYADGAGSVVDLPGLRGRLTSPKPGSAYLDARNNASILITNVTQLDRIEVSLRGNGTMSLSQITSFTGAEFSLFDASMTLPGITNVEASDFTIGQNARLTLAGVTALEKHTAGDIVLTAHSSGFLDLPNVTSTHTENFYQLEIQVSSGGRVNLPRLANVDGALNVYASDAGSQVQLSGLSGRLVNQTSGGFSFEIRNGASVLIPNVTQLDGIDLIVRGTGFISSSQLFAMTQGRLTLDGATGNFPLLLDFTDSDISLYNGAQLSLPFVTQLSRTTSGNLSFTADGAGSVLNLPNVTSASVQPFYQLELFATDGGTILLPALANMAGALDVYAYDQDSLIDLSGLHGTLGIVQPGPHTFNVGPGASILIPNVTGLDQVNLTITGDGTIPTAQLTSLTRSQVRIDDAIPDLLGLTDTTGTTFQYFNGGGALFQPPADFAVTGVFPPATALANQPVPMVWEITNIGTALTNGSWVDALLLSTDGLPGNDLLAGIAAASGNFGAGATRRFTNSVVFPAERAGTWRVAIAANFNRSVFEGTNYFNNTNFSAGTLQVQAPDLVVDSLSLQPNSATLGQSINVIWTVRNAGTAAASTTWSDRLLLVTNANTQGQTITLFNRPATEVLAPNATYTRTQSVVLPLLPNWPVSGNFIAILADAGNAVPEAKETNNVRTAALALTLPPLPDLTIGGIAPPASALAGQPLALVWAVTNRGAAVATGVWAETVFIISTNSNAPRFPLAEFLFTNTLAPSTFITRTQQVALPANFTAGINRILIEADSGQDITESSETNNLAASAQTVSVPAALKLQVATTNIAENRSPPFPTALIMRNGPTTAPLVVTLVSSDPSELTVPNTVTILAGQATATFTPTPHPDGLFDADALVTITASAAGNLPDTASVRVLNADLPQLALHLASTTVIEGGGVVVTVSHNGPIGAAVAVSVVVEGSGQLIVPALVTIPGGASSTNFTVLALDDTLVEPTLNAAFQVSAVGMSNATASIQITDNDLPQFTLTLAATTVSEGAGAEATVATVSRGTASPRSLTVELQSSNTAAARVPDNVVIPSGQASASFPVAAIDDLLVDGAQTTEIRAYALASISGERIAMSTPVLLTVTDDDGPTLTIASAKELVAEGLPNATSLTISRNNATNQALVVSLSSSAPAEATVPATVTLLPGQRSASAPVATVNDGVSDGNKPVTVTASAAGFTSGKVTFIVSDINKPDLVVTDLAGPSSGETEGFINVSYRVLNQGFAPAGTNWATRLFLSSDPLVGDDALLVDYIFNGNLPVGQFFGQSRQIRLPLTPGDYWIVATTDLAGQIDEVLENNNTSVSLQPVHVTAAYQATVQTTLTTAPAGTTLTLTGAATRSSTGGPAPFVLVNIHIHVRGTKRIISAVTDADGNFSITFTPLPGEAGFYEIGAAHPGVANAPIQDAFTLFGMKAEPITSVKLTERSSIVGQLRLANLGDLPLTGLAVTVISNPANVQATATLATNTLAGLTTNILGYALTALDASTAQGPALSLSMGTVALRVTSAEGAALTLLLPVTVESLRARLVASPTELVAGMKVGGQALVQFDVLNAGGATSGPVHVSIPEVPWMRVASPNPMPPLPPGASNRVTLQLTPAANLQLGAYDGTLGVNAGGTGISVPFSFRALSEAKGDLLITAVDEYTFFATGSPKVGGAAVTVRDAVTEAVVATGVTDTNGNLSVNQLQEGYYVLELKAEQHSNYRDITLLVAGKESNVQTFLRRQTVRYIWTVVPTEIEDRTRITIETIFEAFVPIPVITVDPPLIDLADFTADITQIDLKVSNHGLIAAKEAALSFSSHPDWSFEPLISELGDLPARSSLTIPLLIRRTSGSGGGAFRAAGGGACSIAGNCRFLVECGGNKLPGSSDIPIINASASGGCGGGGGGGSPTGGGGGSSGGGGGGGGGADSSTSISSCDQCIMALLSCAFDLSLEDFASCLKDGAACWRAPNASQTAYECMKAGINCSAALGKETMGKMGKVIDVIECLVNVPPACGLTGGGGNNSGGGGGGNGSAPFQAADSASLPFQAAATGTSRVQRAEVVLLQERADWLRAEIGPLRYLMGNDIWFRTGEAELTATWLRAFLARVEMNTDTSNHVSQVELAQLLALPRPVAITTNHVRLFVERWNRTLDYWAAGITQLSQVPAGQNPDFVAVDTAQALSVASDDAFAKSAAQGYSSPDVAYSHTRADLFQFLGEGGGGGVCAHVRLRLEQEAIVTRDAFAASLELDNDSVGPLENISIEVTARRRSGQDATELFGIRPPTLQGLTAVDGSGVVGPGSSGKATWILVPATDAVGSEPEEFLIGGVLKYHHDGLELTVPLAPSTITVFPSPSLAVKYFHQRDVFADDPFTIEVEPSIPYSLAVMVQNKGHGVARNVRINSAQPRIVENEKGLFADFKIIATEVAGQNLTPSLTVDFGAIQPATNAIGRWLLTSTILGGFIDYSATFEHLDGIGNKKMSLIEGVEIHELIHVVRAPGPQDDGRPDFLVNDIVDLYDRPDTLHLSDGSVAPVSVVTDGTVDHEPDVGDLVVQLTASLPSGYAYLRVPDPGGDQFRLTRAVRSDGTEVRFGENVWTTDRTFLGNARRPLREHMLHLFDRDSTGTYFLYYVSPPPGDTNAPSSSVAPLPADSTARIPVNWSGEDNQGGTGISFFDVYVSTDGGPFLHWQVETLDRSGVFQGGFGRTYAFYSVATDLAGNREEPPLTPDAQTTVTRTNHAPTLAALADVAVKEGETLRVQAVAADADGDDLTFSLGPNAPIGVTIHPFTGLVSWPTGEGSGPAQYTLTVQVLDNGSPRLGAVRALVVTVTDDNSAPILTSIANRTLNEGQLLIITNHATDVDLPAQALTFELGPSAPANATIDPVTGVFQWRPNSFQGGTTNHITIVVRDDGTPNLTSSQSFTVIVRDTQNDFVVSLGTTNLFAGQSATVPLRLTAPGGIEQLSFELKATDSHLVNLALAPSTPEVTSLSFEPAGNGLFRVQFDFDPNQAQSGTRTVANLALETQTSGHSSIAHLLSEGLGGTRGTELLTNSTVSIGRVFVVENEPIVDIRLEAGGSLKLVLYGLPGTTYRLQSSPALGAAAVWQDDTIVMLTGASQEFTRSTAGGSRFYRVLR